MSQADGVAFRASSSLRRTNHPAKQFGPGAFRQNLLMDVPSMYSMAQEKQWFSHFGQLLP